MQLLSIYGHEFEPSPWGNFLRSQQNNNFKIHLQLYKQIRSISFTNTAKYDKNKEYSCRTRVPLPRLRWQTSAPDFEWGEPHELKIKGRGDATSALEPISSFEPEI